MKNSFGSSMQMTIFGESHGPYIGIVLDGLAPGIKIDDGFIKHRLSLRRPSGNISTQRVEADEYTIASGVYNGFTTGTPLTILIPNTAQHSKDYDDAVRIARPGHADYTAFCKYKGFEDYHGGGHFSGRVTAALVAAGAIVLPAIKKKGILIGTHISSLAGICDREFEDYEADINKLSDLSFPVLDEKKAGIMQEAILKASELKDSVGGVLESVILNMPAGIGEPWFDSIEGILSHALFSIPAIKGVEFGDAFNKVSRFGSDYNDPLRVCDGRVITTTNNNGGINGGISNGMPIIFKCAVKPTPSIYKKQESIDINSLTNASLEIKGRHDPAIIHRARIVVDSVAALCVYDMLSASFGTDYFLGER